MSVEELLKVVHMCLRDELIARTEAEGDTIRITFTDGTKREIVIR